MTTRTEAGAEKSFVSTLLPWITAGSLAIVYLLTINHWISFKDVQAVARVTGQTWTPDVYAPLSVLVSSPFRWLPEAWIPLAMNLFSVVCAFFALVLLGRCVALLPHDRTQKQRERNHSRLALLSVPTAWIPPVLAVLACGLQLTFWENATTYSSGIFDLLLFAYAVRCLLEYRIDKRESWLLRAAVVYAAAATDTWILVGLFPFFLGAIIWIMGLSFFQLRFISRLFLSFLAGLLFYFYLPLLHLRSDGTFWAPLKQNLAAELFPVEFIFRYTPHHVQFLLALTSLLPIIIIGVRWKASYGETSELGVKLSTWAFHVAHAALFAICVWATFDTGFGLRDAEGRFPILAINRDRLLPFYFLGAISIGYFAGYFLLVFRPIIRRGRREIEGATLPRQASAAVVIAVLVLTPLGLLFKNVPAIRFSNGPMLQNFATMLTEKLPSNGVILSDGAGPLLVSRFWLARSGKAVNYLFLDTQALRSLAYYRFQTRQHPNQWPQVFTNITRGDAVLGDVQLQKMLKTLAEKHPIYYLHPSFGYYFEAFYAVPHGLVNELRPYSTNDEINPPPLSEAEFAENESFWKQHDAELRALLPAMAPRPPEQNPPLRQRWMETMHIPFETNSVAVQLGSVYSRSLNAWGVAAQRLGRLEVAGAHFEEAEQFAPENVVASANADFNQKLRKGERADVDNPAAFQERFGNFNDWQQILNLDGPFDEPTGCLAQGIVFARGRLDREAAQNFLRSLSLAPQGLVARLWLARVYVVLQMPDKALALVNELRRRSNAFADAAINPADVFQVELAATYVGNDRGQTEHLVNTTISQNPPDPELLQTAVQVSSFYRDFPTTLLAINKQLEIAPNNATCLINKGFIYIQLTNYNEAIPPLTKAISLEPTNTTAIFCRAISYFESGKLNEAQHDYEVLQKFDPKGSQAYHGLAEVALRKQDTNTAIRYFQMDLTNAPANSPEAKYASDRLKDLKKPSP